MARIGVPIGCTMAFLWMHHLDPTARSTPGERLRDLVWGHDWLDCTRLSEEVFRVHDRRLSNLRPDCIIAYAGALAGLADLLVAEGRTAGYPRICCVTGAEKLWAEQRATVAKAFRCPVHERYGGRDVGLLGLQLDPERDLSFTVDWASVLVEPEFTGAPSPILVTKLHADAMPMLRYRIGDMAIFPDGAQPGHPSFQLREVLGRDVDAISLPDGRQLHGLALPHLMKDFKVREFQLHQHLDYSIELSVVARDGFADEDRRQIIAVLAQNLPGLQVDVRVVEGIQRSRANKWRPVTSDITMHKRRSGTQC